MPYSSGTFDEEVATIIRAMSPSTVLDIGAGAGRYGHLIKKVSPQAHVTALELDAEYIARFQLRQVYDVVRQDDVESLFRNVDTEYDLVILGDVIEHLRKSVGIDLLNFLVYRSRRILVIFPLRYRQGAFEGRSQEAHISVWGPTDFQWCDADYRHGDGLALVDIRGFVP